MNGTIMSVLSSKLRSHLDTLDEPLGSDDVHTAGRYDALIDARGIALTAACRSDDACQSLIPKFREAWNKNKEECNFVERKDAPPLSEDFFEEVGETLYRGTNAEEEFAEGGTFRGGGRWTTTGVKYVTACKAKARRYANGLTNVMTKDFGFVMQLSTRKLAALGLFRTGDEFRNVYGKQQRERDVLFSSDVFQEMEWVPFITTTHQDFVGAIEKITVVFEDADDYDDEGVYDWFNTPPRFSIDMKGWYEQCRFLDTPQEVHKLAVRVEARTTELAKMMPGGTKPISVKDAEAIFSSWKPSMPRMVAMVELRKRVRYILESVDSMISAMHDVYNGDLDENEYEFDEKVKVVFEALEFVRENVAVVEDLNDYVDDACKLLHDNVYAQLQTLSVRALKVFIEGYDTYDPLLPPDFDDFTIDKLIEVSDSLRGLENEESEDDEDEED